MTEAMLFLQKTILLSYDPRPFLRLFLFLANMPCINILMDAFTSLS